MIVNWLLPGWLLAPVQAGLPVGTHRLQPPPPLSGAAPEGLTQTSPAQPVSVTAPGNCPSEPVLPTRQIPLGYPIWSPAEAVSPVPWVQLWKFTESGDT